MNSRCNDDLSQRVLILWTMAPPVICGNNVTLVDEENPLCAPPSVLILLLG